MESTVLEVASLTQDNVKLLVEIQKELRAPKGQYNKFGQYNYRSAEDIIDAAKPIVHARGCVIGCTDQIVFESGRFYVQANAFIIFPDAQVFGTSGYAREEETKKGMDGSQVTGAASSYARKYALNGLLAIDDSKDSDATNDHGKTEPQQKPQAKPAAKPQAKPAAKEPTALELKQKEFGQRCREYRKSEVSSKKPLDGILFDKLKENGYTDIKSLSECTNDVLFSELIDIIDLELGSAK